MNKLILATLFSVAASAQADTIEWAGSTWNIREGMGGPCGTNVWDKSLVSVDASGALHLKLKKDNQGHYKCASIRSIDKFGFGTYKFHVEGPIGSIDKNVVLGMFLYPTPEAGPDGTNELDIEISRWGIDGANQINYTAWFRSHKGNRIFNKPVDTSITSADYSINWQPETAYIGDQTFAGDIARQPQFLSVNLWLFKSAAPSNDQDVEFIIRLVK